MKTPKSLQRLADSIGAFIEPLKFDFQGLKKFNGYAIVDADNNELMEIQPVHYSNPRTKHKGVFIYRSNRSRRKTNRYSFRKWF